MLSIRPTARFKKDLLKASRQGKNIQNLQKILERLATPEPLPPRHRDHKLKGEWRDFRECHIEPDWLLLYCIEGKELILVRTGSHSDLFG